MGQLKYGIHSRTLMSRDIGHTTANSESEARKKIAQIEKDIQRWGMVIWYAHYYPKNSGEYIEVHAGNEYE